MYRVDHKAYLRWPGVPSLHVVEFGGTSQTAVDEDIPADNRRDVPVSDRDVVEGLIGVLTLNSLSCPVTFHTIVGHAHVAHDVMSVGDQEFLAEYVG